MDTASLSFTAVFCILLLAGLAMRMVLASRQIRHVARHRDAVPTAFAQTITPEAHRKAADYTITKTRFGLLELALESALLLAWTLLGGLDWLNMTLLGALGGGMVQQLALLAAFVLIGGLVSLPMNWWSTFRIEERFGFNKMTPGMWVGDLLKGTLVGALIGLPIAALMLWLMGAAGPLWWIWAWGA
ncbi:MAG: peptidase M48, partial [Comamonadaceae bacterium]|nr:peptidase M48 [Comamonadaceae bacterium]